jgi:spore germination protein YaaH
VSKVGASKVILGVPYYGRKSCVTYPKKNPYPSGAVAADTYLDAVSESSQPQVRPGSFTAHRDVNDPSGMERWDSWFNTDLNCYRVLYWDDTVSLGKQYDLVNIDKLRGVGSWNLNYGGGRPSCGRLSTTTSSRARPIWAPTSHRRNPAALR